MIGKLTWVYMPVADLKSALRFYRDQLGLEESWREGETTVAFKLPDSDVERMVDQAQTVPPNQPGPYFFIDSVDSLYSTQQGKIEFVAEPMDIPGGRLVSAKDPAGNMIYFADQSRAS
jgi:predicted enzyme related to lactoylglutathione lyase